MCDTIWGVQTKRREGGLNEPMCFIIHGSRNSYTASIRRNTVPIRDKRRASPNGMRLQDNFRQPPTIGGARTACATKLHYTTDGTVQQAGIRKCCDIF